LAPVVEKAEQELAGYRAIGVTPEVEQGHATAEVSLVKGKRFKMVFYYLE
jgi:hypothetical protein